MKWYGLTGGWAVGKSSVAALLQEQGVPVVAADALAHRLMQAGGAAVEPLRQAFGNSIVGPEGVDRKKLAQLVFQEAQLLKKLEAIVHPLVRQQLQQQGAAMAFYEVPLLFEKNMAPLFDAVVVVHCWPEQQLKRIQQRTGLDLKSIQQRLQHQWPLEKKRQLADHIIDNTKDLEALRQACSTLVIKMQKL